MRTLLLILFAVGLSACGRIDSNRSRSAMNDNMDEANSRLDRAARPAPAGESSIPTANATVPRSTAEPTPPDNTALNERDREPAAKTPLDQKDDTADVNITRGIRQRIVDHKDMSINARNVKIITADGKVTLRGPVNSADEHDAILKIARDLAGADNVVDELEVKPANP